MSRARAPRSRFSTRRSHLAYLWDSPFRFRKLQGGRSKRTCGLVPNLAFNCAQKSQSHASKEECSLSLESNYRLLRVGEHLANIEVPKCRYFAKLQAEMLKPTAASAARVSSCSGIDSRAASALPPCTKFKKRFAAITAPLPAQMLTQLQIFRSRTGAARSELAGTARPGESGLDCRSGSEPHVDSRGHMKWASLSGWLLLCYAVAGSGRVVDVC